MATEVKISKKSFFIPNILVLLGLGLIVRVCLAWFGTLNLDQGTFIAWSDMIAKSGPKHLYDGWSDYLPGYFYILWFLGKIRGTVPDMLLYKLPAILADVGTGFLVYKIVSKLKNLRWGLIAAALYLFNPAVLANSTFWGQIDSLTAFFALFSVFILPINLPLSAVSLAVGTLIKPQAAFVLPVILFLLVKNKFFLKKICTYGILAFGFFVAGFIPFNNESNLINFILQRLTVSANQYPYGSVNAYSFWGLFGFWRPDTGPFPLAAIGVLILMAVLAFVFTKVWRRKGREFLLMTILFLGSFLFLTRMHERHLLPALAPLAVSAGFWPELIIPYVLLSLTYLANLTYSYNWITHEFVEIFPALVNKFFIILNLASFSFITWRAISDRRIGLFLFRIKSATPVTLPKINLSPQTVKPLLGSVLLLAFVSRVAWLNSPPSEYFDEVYHAFTARQILHGNPMAWEWWNTPPEGFAYEWTHPPLAKLGMVLGMKIFGENSFGWRIPGALLGVGSVFLIYLIAKELFKDELLGILAAAVFSLDGLGLVMSRIGMNDSYLLFFTLASIFLFVKNQNYLSAISFGLALASKWSVIWAIPIFIILWLRRKEKFTPGMVWFAVMPPLIYLASYIPMFLTNHGLDIFWGMQKQMWWYHTGLRATHPYTSPWWNWPLLVRPIYLYTSDEIGGMVSRIYAMGNPVIFWSGLAAIIYSFSIRNKNLMLIIFSYFIFFVPWAASPRIMFLYHYLPSLPFLAMATGYVLRRNLRIAFAFLAFAFLAFIYFYPHWAGLNIPLWLDKSYYWFTSWR